MVESGAAAASQGKRVDLSREDLGEGLVNAAKGIRQFRILFMDSGDGDQPAIHLHFLNEFAVAHFPFLSLMSCFLSYIDMI